MTVSVAIVAFVVIAIACTFQASIGFGANLIAQPIIYQLDPDLVPGPVLMSTTALSLFVFVRERQGVEVRSMSAAVAGAIIGIGIGVGVIRVVSETVLGIVIACCVLAMVAIVAFGSAPPRTPTSLGTAGVLGGFGSATAGIGGPPIALLYADADGPEFRPVLAGYILLASGFTFLGLAIAGRFGVDEIVNGLLLLPAAVLGFAVSTPLLAIVDRGATRPAILLVSAAAGLSLLLRALLGS